MNRDVRKTAIGLLYRLFDVYFRDQRNRQFVQAMGITPETTVLDVGGTQRFWNRFPVLPKVTIVNLRAAPEGCSIPYVQGSACALPFPDKSFDVVFSNSMIEHLGTWENQVQAAREMERVGRRLWVQTPARSFPVDPHLLTPFVHWLPSGILKKIIPYTLAGRLWRMSQVEAEDLANEIRLLNMGDVRSLFPTCGILTETVGGLTKSIIAIAGS